MTTKYKNIVLDTNIFLLLIIGLIDKEKISSNKRTSIYTNEDFNMLVNMIGDFNKILTCPNVWTEIDNLCNRIQGKDQWTYLETIKNIMDKSVEEYHKSRSVVNEYTFQNLGLTDSVLLLLARDSSLLISGDSSLCDYAKSRSIDVFDFKEHINLTRYSN